MGGGISVNQGDQHPFVCHTCCIRFMCQRPAFEETYLPRCPFCDSDEFIEDIHQPIRPADPLSDLTSRLEGHGERLSSTAIILHMLEQQLRDELSEATAMAQAQRQSVATAANARDPVPLCIIETFPEVDRSYVNESCCICSEDYDLPPPADENSKEAKSFEETQKNIKKEDGERPKEAENTTSESLINISPSQQKRLKRVSIESPDPCKLPGCGHIFHRNCIGRWLRRKNTCPVCRSELETVPSLSSLQKLSVSDLLKHMSRWGLEYDKSDLCGATVNGENKAMATDKELENLGQSEASLVEKDEKITRSESAHQAIGEYENTKKDESESVDIDALDSEQRIRFRLKYASELHAYLSRKPKGEEEEVKQEWDEVNQPIRTRESSGGSSGGGSVSARRRGAISGYNSARDGLGLLGSSYDEISPQGGERSGSRLRLYDMDNGGGGGGDDDVVSAMARSMAITMERSAAARRRAALLRHTSSFPASSSQNTSFAASQGDALSTALQPRSNLEPNVSDPLQTSSTTQSAPNHPFTLDRSPSYNANNDILRLRSQSMNEAHSAQSRSSVETRNRNNREELYQLQQSINDALGGSSIPSNGIDGNNESRNGQLVQPEVITNDSSAISINSTRRSIERRPALEESTITVSDNDMSRETSALTRERVLGSMMREGSGTEEHMLANPHSSPLLNSRPSQRLTSSAYAVPTTISASSSRPSYRTQGMRVGGVLGTESSRQLQQRQENVLPMQTNNRDFSVLGNSSSTSEPPPSSRTANHIGQMVGMQGRQPRTSLITGQQQLTASGNPNLVISPIRPYMSRVVTSNVLTNNAPDLSSSSSTSNSFSSPGSIPTPNYSVSLNPSGTFTVSSTQNNS